MNAINSASASQFATPIVPPSTDHAPATDNPDDRHPVWILENGKWQLRESTTCGYLEGLELRIGIFSVCVRPSDPFAIHPKRAEFEYLATIGIGLSGELFGLRNVVELLTLFSELRGGK